METGLLRLEPARRDALINAALQEFAQKGFDAASTNRIAKTAGISKALLFHYCTSKQDLFLVVYAYCTQRLDSEYFEKMDFSEKDIFKRLHQSYQLQIHLLQQYPYIFKLNELSGATKSDAVNQALQTREKTKPTSCGMALFDGMDDSRFRAGLDIVKCKQFIAWVNIGFTNQILAEINHCATEMCDYERITMTITDYLDELRKIFYRENGE